MRALPAELDDLLARGPWHARHAAAGSAGDFSVLTRRLPDPPHPNVVALWEWHDGPHCAGRTNAVVLSAVRAPRRRSRSSATGGAAAPNRLRGVIRDGESPHRS